MSAALPIALAAALLCVAGVALVIRRMPDRSAAALAMLASLMVYALTLVASLWWLDVVLFWELSVVYWFLALCFLMVFGAVYKSISLRILLDLLEAPDRSEPRDVLLRRYIQRESYGARLELISRQNFVRTLPAGLELSPKGRRLAEMARFVQRLTGIQRSG